MKSAFFSLVCWFIGFVAFGQTTGTIEGNVVDKNTQERINGAALFVDGTSIKTLSNEEGHFSLLVPTGTYNITLKSPGYLPLTKYNIQVNSGNSQILNFEITPIENELDELIVTENKGVKADATDMVTPLSVQRLTSEEIKSNPGGNYDVSKVVQTLPGVGGSYSGGRNDIIIRGGAPNENVYYLDGIEIPVFNHFQTQGSSGGAQGIVNVSFIDEIKLSSSAFDARYDNALASTFVIKQRQGNSSHFSGNARTGLTETALTLEGPLGKKTDFLAAGRISYLDFLFKLIDLPIRPRYQDYQFNTTTRLNSKTTLKFIGLGAIDKFNFGATRDSSAENEYFRRSLPFIQQWNYTVGATLRRQISKGFINIAVSRNVFTNQLDRFSDAKYGNETYRNFGLTSQEIENKLRADINKFVNGWKFSAGLSFQWVHYSTDIYSKLSDAIVDSTGTIVQPAIEIKFNSSLSFAKMGAFSQVSKAFFNDQLLVSTGIRSDINTFTTHGMNPLSTLSPRLSLAYSLNAKTTLTGSIGSYYKIPTYTVLGYKTNAGEFANKSVDYIHSVHYVVGSQFLPNPSLRFTVEGFYKTYSNYPVSVANGISLANQGQEFGSVGNEAVVSSGIGKCVGVEFFVQQKLLKKLFYFISYTYVRSKFSGIDGKLLPSAWDNQHLLSGTLGYKFGKNWQLGAKYRLAGGLPYTPFNMVASQQNFALLGTGTLDYSNVNSERLPLFQQLDLRIDKTWNLKKISFVGFIDIQNITGSKQQGTPYYTFQRNATNTGYATTDGQPLKQDGSNGIPVILKNESTTVVPTLGLILQF